MSHLSECVRCVQCAAFFTRQAPWVYVLKDRGTPLFFARIPPTYPRCFLAIGLLVGLLSCRRPAHSGARSRASFDCRLRPILANLAAKRAVDATLNHDLVSLQQVVLQDVVDNPRTLLASIHDVENNLLVQAGSTQASPTLPPRSFSAPFLCRIPSQAM